MIATIVHNGKNVNVDFSKPIDISLAVKIGGVKAWYVTEPCFVPVRLGDWVGEVKQGGSVNFRDIIFNPHGHGTHTECVGHISKEDYSINDCLKQFMFIAKLITVIPEKINDDLVITKNSLLNLLNEENSEALIIRTSSDLPEKLSKNYSNTNPAYIHEDAIKCIIQKGFNHLLFDTPSVDKEDDKGQLLAHRAFWEYPDNIQKFRTITELVYIPDLIIDGEYFLNLQVAAFENDAAPSRPVLYEFLS